MINAPKELKEGQMVINLDYNRCDSGESYLVDKVFEEEYNNLYAHPPLGQPPIRLVGSMEKHLGGVDVRFSTEDGFILKVRIIGFENRTEANLVITREDAKEVGITRIDLATRMLPKMKGFVLEQINKKYPHFWDLNY